MTTLELEILAPMDSVPEIQPKYYVPRLLDKPQNPIMDTLYGNYEKKPHVNDGFLSLPTELAMIEEDIRSRKQSESWSPWEDAARTDTGSRNRIKSWDALRSSHPSRASSAPFLSEQSNLVFAAAQYHVLPRLSTPGVDTVRVTLADLFKSLKLTVLGTSGTLHAWDVVSETFVQPRYSDGQRGIIMIDGNDEVVSASVIQRFVTIGTLLRRLEIFVASLRARSTREGPTIHAFTHALASILSFLREMLAHSPPSNGMVPEELQTLTIWTQYAEFEELLVALSVLCCREQDKSPVEYAVIDSSPALLLSHIYDNLNAHIERHSSRFITASFLYILSITSRDYIRHICHSVGFNSNGRPHQVIGEVRRRQTSFESINEDEDEGPDDDGVLEAVVDTEGVYPTFFPSALVIALPTAKKSLELLQAAQPDHPLAKGNVSSRDIEWLWTEEQNGVAWKSVRVENSLRDKKPEPQAGPGDTIPPHRTYVYNRDIVAFHVFDLEPGAHLMEHAKRHSSSTMPSLQTFLATCPEGLPSMTPTLSLLTSHVFSPLVDHAASLSGALLSLILSPSSHFNLHAHLTLLRSYLLLTSYTFKSRLASALFSDAEDYSSGNEGITGMRAFTRPSRRGTMGSKNIGERTNSWPVGLASSLAARETWPPGGADLSFHLRTVIVDSLELSYTVDDKTAGTERVLEEAEVRLGFAIRDLPVGAGRDRWLNPLSIEALDFLYMDYKPPHPLGVLITRDILSKYQRVFTFILRMMRVENVVRALFRMTREPLFPTLASSHKLLLHFRFVAQSFVASLSEYVFDTAIAGNFDAFLSRLSPMKAHIASNVGFSDVFSLATHHSAVLDNVLSACLLRSGQRAVGNLLLGALELVLDFGILVGELKRGNLQEFEAAPLLEDLFHSFRGRMKTLAKVLQALVNKSSPSPPQTSSSSKEKPLREPPGGNTSLHHLLIRLDIGEWWTRTANEQSEVTLAMG